MKINPALSNSTGARIARFFAFPEPKSGVNFAIRERVRRGQLVAVVVLGLMGIVILIIPATLFIPNKLVILILGLLLGLCALSLFLNRSGRVNLAGTIVVIAVEIVLFATILTTRPFDAFNLPLFDLLCVSIILSISLLPPYAVLIILSANSLLIWWSLSFQEHTATFMQILETQYYNALIRPVALQIILSVVCYLWVTNTRNAIKRADRAEEIAKLEHALADHHQRVADEKQKLEESIQELVQAHIDSSNTNIIARIPQPKAQVLLPLVGAMNSLWIRLQRARQAEDAMQRLQREIIYYADRAQKVDLERELEVPSSLLGPLIRAFNFRMRWMRTREK